jgi:hypothetical protein
MLRLYNRLNLDSMDFLFFQLLALALLSAAVETNSTPGIKAEVKAKLLAGYLSSKSFFE